VPVVGEHDPVRTRDARDRRRGCRRPAGVEISGRADELGRQRCDHTGDRDDAVRNDIKAQLISEGIFNKVTKDVKVSKKEIHDYYTSHKSLYQQPETRDVRYILVGNSKATAQSVYQQLKAGNAKTWCTLAKKYAKDASGQNCGKATFSKGQTVKVFDSIAFSAPTNQVHAPFYDPTQYKAWFVVEPIGPVKPASTTAEKDVSASISTTLLQQKKNQAMSDWASKLTKNYCSDSRVKYQPGYAPSPDPCTATTTAVTT
jgi:parvulin-like peptidyl-prolyl isomerase